MQRRASPWRELQEGVAHGNIWTGARSKKSGQPEGCPRNDSGLFKKLVYFFLQGRELQLCLGQRLYH